MTCQHCCDANKIFDIKSAKKELKRYRKKGAIGATKKLLAALSSISKKDKTLLDIGGGIGAIQWDFIEDGGAQTLDIDGSAGYIEVAQEYASEKNWLDKTTFKEGDVNDVISSLDNHDFVTLDKVICCYPDYELILKNAMDKCNEYLALTFPMSSVISRTLNLFPRFYFWIKRSEFKTYIHSNQAVEALIQNGDFTPIHKSTKFPWRVQVYRKNTSNTY